MRTRAKQIQCAAFAGLTLVGQSNGKPVYDGTPWQWSIYNNNLAWVEEHGKYMWEKISSWEYKKLNVKHI